MTVDTMTPYQGPMIYIDASRYNNTERQTGVENYSFFLLNALARLAPRAFTLISPRSVPLPVAQIVIPLPRLWTQFRLSAEVLINRDLKTLFIPSHVMPVIHPKRTVITLHDAAFRWSPDSYRWASRLYLDWSTGFALKKAMKVITPSWATRADLVHFYHADPAKIEVIPMGFDPPAPLRPEAEAETLRHFGLQKGLYWLYVGRVEWKKNSDTLLRAFAAYSEKHPRIRLALAGSPGHGGREILESIPAGIRTRVTVCGYVTELSKQALLKNALGFIYPSRQEGFGLPLLEAMHWHLPLVASDIPSSREVAGQSAFFFPAEKADALAEALDVVMRSPEAVREKAALYGPILEKHTWQRCAEKTLALLRACEAA